MTAPCVFDGPINGETFLAWVGQFLVPMLRRGDIVVMDNLSSHEVKGLREAIASVGATSRCRHTAPISIRSNNSSPN
jgi:putative transposase